MTDQGGLYDFYSQKRISRPSFVRDDSTWLCLNGQWDFQIDRDNTTDENELCNATAYEKKIVVPLFLSLRHRVSAILTI